MWGSCARLACWGLVLAATLVPSPAGAAAEPKEERLASVIVKLNPAGPKKADDVLVLTVVDRTDPEKVVGTFTWDEPKESDAGAFVQVPLDDPIPLKAIGGYALVITRRSGNVRYYNSGGAVMGSTTAGAKHILYQPPGEIALEKGQAQVRLELNAPR